MKGAIVQNTKEVIVENFGKKKWNKVMEKSGLDKDFDPEIGEEIPDPKILEVVQNIQETLDISQQQVWDAFAKHWIHSFTPRIAPEYFEADNSQQFLLRLDAQHWDLRNKFENLAPPQFLVKPQGEDIIELTYMSKRGLIDLAVSLVREVGNYYDDEIEVTKLDEKRIKVEFIELNDN